MRGRVPTVLGVLAGLSLQGLLGGVAAAQLADSPWPMAHHDLRHTGRSQYVGPAAPVVRWRIPFREVKSSPIIGPDGTVYVGVQKSLCAFEPAGGGELWCEQLPATIRRNTAAIDANGRLYVGARDNRLWALDATDGERLWSFAVGNDGDVNTSPAIADDPVGGGYSVYMAGTFNGVVHALDPDPALDGEPALRLKWRRPSGGGISYSSPAVGLEGTVYLGLTTGRLLAVTAAGVEKWNAKVGVRLRFASPAVGDDGTIYVGSYEGVSAVDPVTGFVRWTFPTQGRIGSTPAIGVDGTLYIGTVGVGGGRLSTFYALRDDVTHATPLWSYVAEGSGRFSGAPAIGADGTIYVASGGVLLAFSPAGQVVWEFNAGRRNIISSPAIGADGALYVGGEALYAFNDSP
jgi:outer membrane protein assembly factor BamB